MTRRKEAGQALVFAALGMTVFLGFAGLAIDMGVLRYDRRLQQSAADAAALAGASNLASSSGGVAVGAQAASATNGFTDNSGGATCTDVGCVTVTVNYSGSGCGGPCAGPHTGNPKYVEVLVTTVQPTLFMKALNIPKQTVLARAVATNLSGGGPNSGCMWSLGPPVKKIGFDVKGNPTVNATTCGIVDNGNFDPIGCGGGAAIIHAGTFGVSGSDISNCSGNVTCTGQSASNCPAYNAPAGSDPFSYLTPPCNPCTGGTVLSANSNATFNPGTYTSISLSGHGTVTFNPGIYIIDGSSGGFTCSGSPTINGTGVMFYFTNGATINCQGTDTINLTAPSPTNCPSCAAQYDGILMYQDPNDTNNGPPGQCPPPGVNGGPQVGGNDGSSFNGVLYFPTAQLYLAGNSGTNNFAMTAADSMCLSGNATLNMQGAAGLPPGVSLVLNAVLVE